jgi:hypothetical protein
VLCVAVFAGCVTASDLIPAGQQTYKISVPTSKIPGRSIAANDANRVLVVAAPQDSRYTEWARNWCRGHGGTPEHDGGGFDCGDGGISLGGEFFKVKLADVHVILGRLPRDVRFIGLARHALNLSRHNRVAWLLVLEPAPADFRAATGLTYIASDYGVFRSSIACVQLQSID